MCDAISHFCCISTTTPYGWLDFVQTHWNLQTHVIVSSGDVVWLSPPWYPKMSEDGKHIIIPAMSLWDPNVLAVVDILKDLKNYESAYWHTQAAEKTLLHIDLNGHNSNALNDGACVELWKKDAEHTMMELLVRFTNDTMSSVTEDHLIMRRQERERAFNVGQQPAVPSHETATDHVWPDVGWEHLGVLGMC